MAFIKYYILLNLLTFITCTEIEDPCTSAAILDDDGSRRRSCSYSTGRCDRYLTPDWYRVQLTSTGEDLMMVTGPPKIDSCGTHYPIWLKGEHPLESDGVVERIGCSVYMNTDCNTEYGIKIKNCTNYMVYYLVRAWGCNERYCFEGSNNTIGKCGRQSQSTGIETTTDAITTSTTPSTTSTTTPSTTTSTTTPSTTASTTVPSTTTSTTTPSTTTSTTTPSTTASTTTPSTITSTTTSRNPTTRSISRTESNNRFVNNLDSRNAQYISNGDELSDKDIDDGVPISAFIGMTVLAIILIIAVGLLIFYMVVKKGNRKYGNLEKYITFESTSDLNSKI